MGLARFAPTLCFMLVIGCAAIALADVLTTGPYPHQEIETGRLPLGFFITITGMALVTWLTLDTRDGWAKAALALLLVGGLTWWRLIGPAYMASGGLDDCIDNCIRSEHIIARADVVQGKWGVLAVNIAAALCVAIALHRRARALR